MTSFRSILEMMMNDGESLLERLVGAYEDAADRLNPLLITGTNPATEIVKLIDQGDYDLVVIGNRGLSGMKEYIRQRLVTRCCTARRCRCSSPSKPDFETRSVL